MFLKKRVVPLLAGLLTVFLLAAPASAHGGHHHGGGHGCAAPQVQTACPALCRVEGCTEPGRHIHDGSLVCGYAHEAGCCDGSCAAVLAAQAAQDQFLQVWTGCFGGHRGWHCWQ